MLLCYVLSKALFEFEEALRLTQRLVAKLLPTVRALSAITMLLSTEIHDLENF